MAKNKPMITTSMSYDAAREVCAAIDLRILYYRSILKVYKEIADGKHEDISTMKEYLDDLGADHDDAFIEAAQETTEDEARKSLHLLENAREALTPP